MNWRKVFCASLCAALLACAASWAAVCPLCLQQIPDGEKYCARHKAEALAQTLAADDEQKLADDMVRARADYEAKLAALEKYYEGRGNAERLSQVRQEIKGTIEARRFESVYWEDRLPEISATREVPEAAQLLKEADAARTALNPLNRGDRFKEAAAKYQQILIQYPNSTATDSAAFGLGEIYSSGIVGEPARAVKLYRLAYLANPNAPKNDAVYRAAEVCDKDLSEYEHAAYYYWLAARRGQSLLTRKQAAYRLAQLQKKDFGKSYSLDEKPPAPADARPAQ